jgi:hypothetical protein
MFVPAMAEAQIAIQLEPTYADAHAILGALCASIGNEAMAFQSFQTADRLGHPLAKTYIELLRDRLKDT